MSTPTDEQRKRRVRNAEAAASAWAERNTTPTALPVSVEVALHPYCNAQCLFCDTGRCTREVGIDDSFDWLAERVLEELAPQVERLHWTHHAEPLLSRHFVQWLGEAEAIPDLRIQTNGFLLPKYRDELLRAPGSLHIGVSLHAATAAMHARLMGCSTTKFDDIVGTLRTMVQRRSEEALARKFSILFVAQRSNLHELADFVRLGIDIGVDSYIVRDLLVPDGHGQRCVERDGMVYFQPGEVVLRGDPELEKQIGEARRMLSDAGLNEDRLWVDMREGTPDGVDAIKRREREFRELYAAQAGQTGPGGASSLSVNVADTVGVERFGAPAEPTDIEATPDRSGDACELPWTSAWIDGVGDVRPCLFTDYTFGNLRDASMQEVWSGPRARHMREIMAARGVPSCCAECPHYSGGMPPDPLRPGSERSLAADAAAAPVSVDDLPPLCEPSEEKSVVVQLVFERLSARTLRTELSTAGRVIRDFDPPTESDLADDPHVAYLFVSSPDGGARAERYHAPYCVVPGAPFWPASTCVRFKVMMFASIDEPTLLADGCTALVERLTALLDGPIGQTPSAIDAVNELFSAFRRGDIGA